MTVRALLLLTLQLRSESVDASIEERHFTHALEIQHHHEHAGETEAVPAMRWTSVAEEVQVILNGLEREPLLLGLLHQNIVAMLALRSRRHLKPLPEKVETFGEMGFVLRSHMIERTHDRRILGNENEGLKGEGNFLPASVRPPPPARQGRTPKQNFLLP